MNVWKVAASLLTPLCIGLRAERRRRRPLFFAESRQKR